MSALAVSCMTTSSLPWFMDLTLQAPLPYCSLYHVTLLPSPVTSTTVCCFCFGSVSSFFVVLFLHWSPVAYWAPSDLGSSSSSVLPLEQNGYMYMYSWVPSLSTWNYHIVNWVYLSTKLEKDMATHSRILAWRIPGTGESGGLPSVGSHRVGHDWSDLACTHALEKDMATHSRILAWRIPGTGESGGLPSVGSHRVGHDWSDLAAAVQEESGGEGGGRRDRDGDACKSVADSCQCITKTTTIL